MTQKQRLLKYLNDYGSVTALEAVRDLGILQLSARLVELEKSGYRFKKEQESSLNRYGEKVYYTRYSIAE